MWGMQQAMDRFSEPSSAQYTSTCNNPNLSLEKDTVAISAFTRKTSHFLGRREPVLFAFVKKTKIRH
jgi:hypothetical protein